METKRYDLFDSIRGLAIVNMIAFHFLFDWNIIYGKNPDWYSHTAVHIWQQCICWTFILLSGFVWQWGRKTNLRRGIMINICGFIITAVTCVAVPSQAVWFGILNFIGCAVLLMMVLHKYLMKVPAIVGIVISMLLFAFTYDVQMGHFSMFGLFTTELPQMLYECKILLPIGFKPSGFYSSDFFPMLPWMFLYIAGAYIFKLTSEYKLMDKAKLVNEPYLSAVGRKSIWIYMLHQPACMAICEVII